MLYLAGPMRGYPRANFGAFEDGATVLRAQGHEVLSPAEHDLEVGIDPWHGEPLSGLDLRAVLCWDMYAVLMSDAVILLPGWRASKGASAEAALAIAAGIPAYEYHDFIEARMPA